MIKDLQELGKWLDDNNQVSFNNINDTDYIFYIIFENNNFTFKNIKLASDISFDYYEKSVFNKELQFSSNQNYIIANNSNLIGLTPFLVKIGMLKNDNDITKFKDKIKRSMNSHKNNKEFVGKLIEIYDNYEDNFLNRCTFIDSQKEDLKFFFENNSCDELSTLIINYFSFLYDNFDEIISKIKEIEDYKNNNFYLACVFNSDLDLLNDIFFNYSKYLKKRKEDVDDFKEGICSICGSKITVYPTLSCFANKSIYFFNNDSDLKNSHLQLCNKCNSYIKFADEKLINVLNFPNIMVIPKIRSDEGYAEFLKIANQNINSFDKLNEFLKGCVDFNFDLIIYKNENKLRLINKYIENYNAFLLKFENLNLFSDSELNYILHKSVYPTNYKRSIDNSFNFEKLFKECFFYFDKDKIKYFNQPFYKIYSTDRKKLFKKGDSKSRSIFLKYCDNIFSFIYELKFEAINKKILNEIVLNSVLLLEKNKNNFNYFKQEILKRLNFYFMFNNEFLGENMLSKENVIKLKNYFNNSPVYIDDEFNDIIEGDPALKYYIIGQFISLIDDKKEDSNKNRNIFSNFITHINRNNIKKNFVTEVLQKNTYYIDKLNVKERLMFNILELNMDNLFDENNLDYEDYLLLIFTGYYSDKIF